LPKKRVEVSHEKLGSYSAPLLFRAKNFGVDHFAATYAFEISKLAITH